jgi:hypothetical protein
MRASSLLDKGNFCPPTGRTAPTKLDLRFSDDDKRVWKQTPRSNQP